MTTHGQSERGRWLFGSVAAEVLRRAHVPVGLVSSGVAPTHVFDQRPTILVPLDGSELGEAAPRAAADMAAHLTARVALFEAVSPPVSALASTSVDVDSDARLWQARRYLIDVARCISPIVRYLDVRTAIGYPAVAIPRAASEIGSDFILLATHGPNDTTYRARQRGHGCAAPGQQPGIARPARFVRGTQRR